MPGVYHYFFVEVKLTKMDPLGSNTYVVNTFHLA